MVVVKIENLSHYYGKSKQSTFKALDSVSLEIEKGNHIGIIGHVGSGKSTLVKIIGGLLKPSSGSVLVCGMDVCGKGFKSFGRKVGFVFQNSEYSLFEETVEKDIAFGLKNYGFSKNLIKEKVEKAAFLVGLKKELLLKNPLKLSGGEKKRVALAGVLVLEPEVLILDEPTVGLDPSGRRRMMEFFDGYRKQNGCTIIHVTHDMDEILEYGTKILVLNRGGVYFYGGVDEFFEKAYELEGLNLKLSQLASVFLKLKQKGLNVPINVKNLEDGVRIIENIILKGKADD